MAADSHLAANLNHLFDNFELLPLVQEGRELHLVHARLACPGTPRDKFKFKITINSRPRKKFEKKKTGQLFSVIISKSFLTLTSKREWSVPKLNPRK